MCKQSALEVMRALRKARKLDSSIPLGLARLAESKRSADAIAAYTALAVNHFDAAVEVLEKRLGPEGHLRSHATHADCEEATAALAAIKDAAQEGLT